MFYLGGAVYYAPNRLILSRIGYYHPKLYPIQNIGLGIHNSTTKINKKGAYAILNF